ncbi:Hypothetical predicted protein [Mytilus galloprovincialis]|uniref:B box-type domain-containing protein n=1 Tax=Mytilus galloprovincialis TaxID=29158 RepID=A0A8B6G5R3_MYTGA|nr:Hypothetical predicted protein [Mytilus galloprovincialis]
MDLSKPPDAFCPQCEDFLCGACQNHHKVAKLLISHQTISIVEYMKLPTFIKNVNIKCADHENIFEFYCKTHDNLCCKQCLITSHNDCNEITLIEDLLSMSALQKTSALNDIEQILKCLSTNIHTAIDDRKRHLDEIQQQKDNLLGKIKEKREEINNLLDLLEKSLLQELSEVEKESSQKMEMVIKELEERSSIIIQLQSDIALMKCCTSNFQIFMGVREMTEHVSSAEKHIKSICKGSLNNVTIECIFNDQLNTFIENINTLGKIEMTTIKSEISFSWADDKTAQLYTPRKKARPFKDIQVELVHRINTRGHVTGCVILPTGKILLTDYNYSILIYDKNGGFETRINVESSHAFSLAVVDETTVVISAGGWEKNLVLLDFNSGNIIKEIPMMSDWCYGVSVQNGSYIVSTNIGIQILSTPLEGVTNIMTLSGDNGNDSYIASCQNCIIHSDYNSDSITCLNFKCELLWTYKDPTLRKPCGITVDSDSNIYVAGSASNNIVLISPDGANAKPLLDSSHGILDPRAIYFDKKENVLLVSNYQGSAFVYAVS